MFVYIQMGGIDEASHDRLSLVTQMTKHIRVKASGGTSSRSELGMFSPIFAWLLRDKRFHNWLENARDWQSAEVDFGARLFRYGSAMMGRKSSSWIPLSSLKSSLVSRPLLLLFAFVCFVSISLSAATTCHALLKDRLV